MDERLDYLRTNNACGCNCTGNTPTANTNGGECSETGSGMGSNMACLVVKKVFDACSKRYCFTDQAFRFMLPRGCLDDYSFVDVAFGKAKIAKRECAPFFTPKTDCTATYKGVVLIPVYAYLRERCSKRIIMVPLHPVENGNVCPDNFLRIPFEHKVNLHKRYVLQGRFEPYAESYGQFCDNITLDGNTLRMSVGVFVIIKVVGDTQLKMHHHGNCEIPPECNTDCTNFCEDFMNADITGFPNKFFTR